MYVQTQFGKLGISDRMTAKMKGMMALSTSPLLNKGCARNCKIQGSICQKCYSITANKMYPQLRNMIERNQDILTNNLLPENQIPYINHFIFRFESHGDLNNEMQLRNYVNIAKKNSHVTFALWTKQYKIAERFFDKNEKPSNFILIYSSIMTNIELKLENFKHADKIFTVYNKEFIEKNDIVVNCGAKSCIGCQSCYKIDGPKYMREKAK